MNAGLAQLVWNRARNCCEYCIIPQECEDIAFEIDHIIAKKHGGPTMASNLALSCYHCNSFKGSDVGSLDKLTGKLTPLFNPRRHSWHRHFGWQGGLLLGRTAIGRVTATLLNINDPLRVELRDMLIDEGNFPPFYNWTISRLYQSSLDLYGRPLESHNETLPPHFANFPCPITSSP